MPKYRVAVVATHPIPYYALWYRALAAHPEIDLQVYYGHRASPDDQAQAGFGVPFTWDVPLTDGYVHEFLANVAQRPSVETFGGCDTPAIAPLIHRERFDAVIVHGWATKSFWQAMTACWASGTPLMVRGDSYLLSDHWWPKRWAKYFVYRRFIPRFDAYLVVGQHARNYYRYYGADERRMFSAPHAVDNDFFAARSAQAASARAAVRAAWGLSPDATVFLFAGKLTPKKRPLDFARAIGGAARRTARVQGLIAGDGPLRPALERAARDEGWPLGFAGFLNQTELPNAYAAADALVLPSSWGETWGLVVNEAMACGLPVIVSDRVGCAPDLIVPDHTGRVVPCGDVDRLTACLADWASRPAHLREMGAQARRHIQRWSIAQAVDGTVAALRAVAGRPGAAGR